MSHLILFVGFPFFCGLRPPVKQTVRLRSMAQFLFYCDLADRQVHAVLYAWVNYRSGRVMALARQNDGGRYEHVGRGCITEQR